MLYHEIRIQVGDDGALLGVTLLTAVGSPVERVRPLAWGPFDTPADALETAMRCLPEQLRLWYGHV